MEKKRAIELLIQEVDKIPYLKTLPHDNDEFRLWLKTVENIIDVGLEPEDKQKYLEASNVLGYIRYEEDLIQQDYIDEIIRYEIALKSIIQKYEILWMEGEGDIGGEVKMGDNEGREMNNETEITSIITELENLLKELAMYHTLQRRRMKGERLNEDDLQLIARLRTTLLRKSGNFKSVITDEDRKENIRTFWINGKESLYDIWNTGLKFDFDWLASEALDYCKDATDVAIGKLETDIKKGKRDKQGNLIKLEKTQSSSAKPPKAFISHGKASTALNKLKEFLETLGVEVLIVKKQPSLDKELPDKVNLYLNQADFVIILATADDKVEDKLQPRQNVIHEIGLAQNTHSGKIIYLLEAGAEFPSNIRPKVWESFKQRNMLNAFLGIVRELRAYGMLKVQKP